MARFLFVSSYDLRRNTSSNIRTVALIESLATNGHEVDVAYLQSQGRVDYEIDNSLKKQCKEIYLLVSSGGSRQDGKKNVIANNSLKNKARSLLIALYSKLFVYDVFQTKFRRINKVVLTSIENKYDFVISSSEPRSSHKLARIIINKCKIKSKWIQYWGDPMTNDVASKKFFPFLEKKEEKKLLGLTDVAIYTNPICADYMKKKYPRFANRIYWLPTTDLKKKLASSTRTSSQLSLSYTGDYMSKYRNILPLYNVCKSEKMALTIAGNGDVQLLSTETISVLGRVDREKAKTIENSSSILVVVDNSKKGKDSCIQIPGKLYHFSLTNKYILVITDSPKLIDYYSRFNRFVFCKNNEGSIRNAIKQITDGTYDKKYTSPLEDFSQKCVCKQIMRILNNE